MRYVAGTLTVLAVGLLAAACDAAPLPTPTRLLPPTTVPTPSMSMQRYVGDGFAIDYPEHWAARETGKAEREVFFGPGEADASLGMVVSPVDGARRDPDALLDAYQNHILASVPDAVFSDDRADAPNGGRSGYYQDWRAEPRRQYQATFYVQDGAAYRVVQWSPVADWDRLWWFLFEKMLKGFEMTEAAGQ